MLHLLDPAMRERLIHDSAWALAHALLDEIAPLVPERYHKLLFAKFYNAGRAVVEAFFNQGERIRLGITPANN